MAVKYSCPKCGRRFAEWGAERLGFKCPKDENCPKDAAADIELVRVGVSDDRMLRRPALKKGARRPATYVAPSALSEDDVLVPDIEDIEAATVIGGALDEDSEEFAEAEEAEEEETFAPGLPDEIGVVDVVPVEAEAPDTDEIPVEVDEPIEEIEETAEEEWTE